MMQFLNGMKKKFRHVSFVWKTLKNLEAIKEHHVDMYFIQFVFQNGLENKKIAHTAV